MVSASSSQRGAGAGGLNPASPYLDAKWWSISSQAGWLT
jgi:hypothetical protein